MPPQFNKKVILHIEDDPKWIKIVKDSIFDSQDIIGAYGEDFRHIYSEIKNDISLGNLEVEIGRISGEISNNKWPTLVSIITAQIARGFLSENLPGAIISDTSFPLNGKKVVEWICEHGFKDYAFIGLSGTPFSLLDAEIQGWFGKSNARYFEKLTFCENEDLFISQIIRNRLD